MLRIVFGEILSLGFFNQYHHTSTNSGSNLCNRRSEGLIMGWKKNSEINSKSDIDYCSHYHIGVELATKYIAYCSVINIALHLLLYSIMLTKIFRSKIHLY